MLPRKQEGRIVSVALAAGLRHRMRARARRGGIAVAAHHRVRRHIVRRVIGEALAEVGAIPVGDLRQPVNRVIGIGPVAIGPVRRDRGDQALVVAGVALREQRRPTRPCRNDSGQPQPVGVVAAGLDDPVCTGGNQRLVPGMTGARTWLWG